jgi:hypothetical protein
MYLAYNHVREWRRRTFGYSISPFEHWILSANSLLFLSELLNAFESKAKNVSSKRDCCEALTFLSESLKRQEDKKHSSSNGNGNTDAQQSDKDFNDTLLMFKVIYAGKLFHLHQNTRKNFSTGRKSCRCNGENNSACQYFGPRLSRGSRHDAIVRPVCRGPHKVGIKL